MADGGHGWLAGCVAMGGWWLAEVEVAELRASKASMEDTCRDLRQKLEKEQKGQAATSLRIQEVRSRQAGRGAGGEGERVLRLPWLVCGGAWCSFRRASRSWWCLSRPRPETCS